MTNYSDLQRLTNEYGRINVLVKRIKEECYNYELRAEEGMQDAHEAMIKHIRELIKEYENP